MPSLNSSNLSYSIPNGTIPANFAGSATHQSTTRTRARLGLKPIRVIERLEVWLPLENDKLASGIQPESMSRIGKHLERHGALEAGVASGSDRKQIVRAKVRNDELVAGEETHAVRAGSESLALDSDWRFGDEVGLVLRGDAGGIAGGIDQACPNEVSISKFHAAGVARLRSGALPTIKHGSGNDLGHVVWLEDRRTALGNQRGNSQHRGTHRHGRKIVTNRQLEHRIISFGNPPQSIPHRVAIQFGCAHRTWRPCGSAARSAQTVTGLRAERVPLAVS